MDFIIRSPIRNNRGKMIFFPLGVDKIASTPKGFSSKKKFPVS